MVLCPQGRVKTKLYIMNIEVEIKIKINSLREIRGRLRNYGKLVKSIKQIDEYYIPCHRDFFAQKPFPVEWLRIRTNPDKTIFEYDKSINKNAKGEQEYAEEYETEISQPDELRKILKFLDFKKVVTVDKKREIWNCGNLEICLDKVKNLGYFIELEAKGGFKNPKEAKRGCYEFLNKLGIKATPENIINTGYAVLLLNTLKEKGDKKHERKKVSKKGRGFCL